MPKKLTLRRHCTFGPRFALNFQTPFNCRYKQVLAKTVHVHCNHKNYINRSFEAWITFSDTPTSCVNQRLKMRIKIKMTTAIPRPIFGKNDWKKQHLKLTNSSAKNENIEQSLVSQNFQSFL